MPRRVSLDAEPPQQSAGEGPLLPALACTVLPAADTTAPPPFPAKPLVDVGFWADPRDPLDDRPNPANFVDHEWAATVVARAVAMYAHSGFIESFELGYSWCRFGCSAGVSGGGGGGRGGDKNDGLAASCDAPAVAAAAAAAAEGGRENRLMGCCTLTDGTYVWPEGLAHYLSEHAVRPPDDFIAHALANLQALRSAQAGGRLRWEMDGGGRTVPLASGTAAFLRDKTTLGIALLPSPEIRRSGSTRSSDSDGVCSCKTS
eukprot:jgi/Undpi1/579/HiC_scaffold_10.g04043.m1